MLKSTVGSLPLMLNSLWDGRHPCLITKMENKKTTALHSGNTGVDYVCQVSQVKKDESEHFKIESRC